MKRMKGIFVATFVILVLQAVPVPAQVLATSTPNLSATERDPRWLPWLGCWQLKEEQFERVADRGAQEPDRTFVCITPTTGETGVILKTEADGQVLVERTLVANGTQRPVTDGDCHGWEERSWSMDTRRLFTRAELDCGNDSVRRVNGISFFSTSSTWVDMQLVSVGERQHLEIRRYGPVSATTRQELVGQADTISATPDDIRQARRTNAEELNLVSVQESAQKVDPRVVEAMLTETKPKLALDSKTLITLDNVGIDGGVIDLLVALAYPEQFVVERRSAGGNNGGGSRWYSGGYRSPYYYDPIWYNDLYPYYYTPLGYGSWGRAYSPYFYGGALSPFVVLRDNSFMRTGRTAAIVSPNRGYTRIVPRAGGVSGGGTRSGSGGGGSVSAPRPRSGGSSGGTPRVTNGGYSRGGGGGGGGRRATPRQ